MTASPAYEYLFCFVDETACLAEVRRQDLQLDAPPGKIYHWIYFDRSAGVVTRLLFESMGEKDGWQTRQFVQGSLRFDAVRASVKLEEPLVVRDLAAVPVAPADLDDALRAYLGIID